MSRLEQEVKTLQIETDRLILRPLQLEELLQIQSGLPLEESDLECAWVQDLTIAEDTEYIVCPSMLDSTMTGAIIKKIEKMKEAPEDVHVWLTYFQIRLKDCDPGIGLIGCKGLPDEKGFVELGYCISPEFRGVGYMTEAMDGFLDWLYDHHFLHGAELYISEENEQSRRLALTCGFELTGVYKEYQVYQYLF